MPNIIAWEGMKIPLPVHIEPKSFADRLMRLTESVSFNAFRWKREGLYAGEAVGCIQIGDLRITILPKLDTPEAERDKLFLLNILCSAGYIRSYYSNNSAVKARSLDPLEALIFEITKEMADALREGEPKRYFETHEDSPTIKGRIEFTKLSTRLPGRAEIPIRYSPLSINNELSQVLKGIALFLYEMTRNNINRQRLSFVLSKLSLIKTKNITTTQIDTLKLSRSEHRWKKTLEIGRLLLSGKSPDPTFGGKNEAFSLLFPMQHLYERAVRNILTTALVDIELTLKSQTEPHFLLLDSDNKKSIVRLRPDYIFGGAEQSIIIADAKWKRTREFGSTHGLKSEDLYQIYAYLKRYKALNAFVLTPKASWMHNSWSKTYFDIDTTAKIHIIGINMEGLISRNKKTKHSSYNELISTFSQCLSAPNTELPPIV